MSETRSRKRPGSAVYEKIKEMAICCEFLSGQNINENKLAETLGVSRSPVRDALNRLVNQGLVEFKANHGFFARNVSEKQLSDLMEARLGLEIHAARLAIQKSTQSAIEYIAEIHYTDLQKIKELDFLQLLQKDELFHNAIYKLSDNSILSEHATSIEIRLRYFRRIQLEISTSPWLGFDDHESILDAMLRNSIDDCEKIVSKHLTYKQADIENILREVSWRQSKIR